MKGLLRFALAATAVAGLTSPVHADDRAPGEVTNVSVISAPGRAEVVITLTGAVEVRDFVLRDPARLVLDFHGATLRNQISGAAYDGVSRGGVRNIRSGQFTPQTVRIVLDLDELKEYRLERIDGAVRIVFGAERAFLAWSATATRDLAAVAPAPARAEVNVSAGGSGEAVVTQGSVPRITVTWYEADIRDVVAGFAAFSGRTIILGKGIDGKVTAEIKNQPWNQAFQAILSTQGLSAQELPGGIIRVDSPSALAALDSLEPLQTQIVKVNYVKAAELAKSVEGILTKDRGRVVPDTASNSLIITEPASRVANVVAFVNSLDQRTPQVAIQAKIIFVDRQNLQSLGLKYDLGDQNTFFNRVVQRPDPNDPTKNQDPNSVRIGGSSVAAIANGSSNISNSALDVVWRTAIGGFSLTAFLSALERIELADVQAEPIITTLDNKEADILVGEETPIRVVDASSAAGGTPARANVQLKETGIRLTVTPHVTNNRQIIMDLRTERSAVQALAEADLGFNFPKQTARNRLLVDDGETAVIGGLTITEVNRTRAGIPLLAGLPIVGKLFSFSTDSERRRDLVILVTPRIIDPGTEMAR